MGLVENQSCCNIFANPREEEKFPGTPLLARVKLKLNANILLTISTSSTTTIRIGLVLAEWLYRKDKLER